jgi:hypothetical protein
MVYYITIYFVADTFMVCIKSSLITFHNLDIPALKVDYEKVTQVEVA